MDRTLTIAVPVPPELATTTYRNYFNTLEALGARGVAVGGSVDPEAYDGLLLPGGGDLNPSCYHRCNLACECIDDALDALQLAALEAFVRAGKPAFGVCRGHQLINVFFGGTLIQHLPQAMVHCRCGLPVDKAHGSRAERGSLLYALYGESFPVNSAHHQGIETPAEDLRVTQWSDDGVIEAVEHTSLPVFSVQWHPERACFERAREDAVDGSLVIRRFLEMCGGR